MNRTFIPSEFAKEFAQFVQRTGPVAALAKVLPEFRLASASAVEQVFGMMLNAEVETVHTEFEMTVSLHSTIAIDLDDRFHVLASVYLSEAAVDEINGVLIGPDAGVADRAATSSELVNLVAGRLHAHAGDKAIKSVCSLPETMTHAVPDQLPELPPEQGHTMHFRTSGGRAPFAVSLKIEFVDQAALAN